MIELQEKENQLNKLLVSGLGDYQPQMNMFGSNVFSSVQTADAIPPELRADRQPSNDFSSYQRSIDHNNMVDIKTGQNYLTHSNGRPANQDLADLGYLRANPASEEKIDRAGQLHQWRLGSIDKPANPLLTLGRGTPEEQHPFAASRFLPEQANIQVPSEMSTKKEHKRSPALSKLSNAKDQRSRHQLDKLKDDYNSALIDDMFPVKQ